MSIQIQFNSRHFSIDEATLLLLDFDYQAQCLRAPDGRRLEFEAPETAIEEFVRTLTRQS